MNLKSIENMADQVTVNVNAIDLRRMGLDDQVEADVPNFRPCKIAVGKLRPVLEAKARKDVEVEAERKVEVAAEIQREMEEEDAKLDEATEFDDE